MLCYVLTARFDTHLRLAKEGNQLLTFSPLRTIPEPREAVLNGPEMNRSNPSPTNAPMLCAKVPRLHSMLQPQLPLHMAVKFCSRALSPGRGLLNSIVQVMPVYRRPRLARD